MAQRRMIFVKIIDSAKFLKMPVSSRLLYYDLILRADDDGVVEAYNVMKTTGSTEDDLKVLVSKGFVTVLNEDLVSYVIDWREHNKIRADRKIDSIYKGLLLQVVEDIRLIEPKQRSDTKQKNEDGQPMDGQWTDNGRTMDSIGKVRLGKVSIGKDSIDSRGEKNSPSKTPKHKYGEYGHIRLTDKEYENLISEYDESITKDYIRKMDEYIELKGKGYKNYSLALRNWIKKDKQQPQKGGSAATVKDKSKLRFDNFQGREYDYDSLEKKLLGWESD